MSLENAITELERRFDKGIVMKLSDTPDLDVESIPTGCPSLDIALGIKGFPRGRLIEIYGAEGGGKTSLALQTIAQAQKMGLKCAFLDLEHGFSATYAQTLGVNVDELLVSQPDCAETALEVAEVLVNSGEIGIIVLDSVAAMVTQPEINGEFGDAHVGLLARLMSQFGRKMVGAIAKNNVCFIMLNQIRQNIAISGYGGPTNTTPGGKALKFYASVRLEVTRIGSVKSGEEIIGNETKIKIVKNRFAPPYREVKSQLIFGEGLSKEADILQLGIDKGFIIAKGSWVSYGDDVKIQGRENFRKLLVDNPELYERIKEDVYTAN
jgi:recombination protein RecA